MILGIVAVYFIALSVISNYYRKEIETRVVSEINKNLTKPISIDRISISAFTNFPYVSFRMDQMLVQKSDTSKVPLLKLDKLQILFSPYNILIKNFKVEEVLIADGILDARVDSVGNRDFDIFIKKDSTKVKDKKAISSFSFNKVKFENIHILYENKFKPKRVELTFKNTESKISLDSKVLTGNLIGGMYSDEITLRPGTLFKGADLDANLNFSFDLTTKVFGFTNCILASGKNKFIGNGNIDFKNKSFLTLNIKTTQADIEEVFRLIPSKWTDKIHQLNLKGNVDADATIKISLLPGNQPDFNIDFATKNFSINHDKLKTPVHGMAFQGNLNSTSSTKMEDCSISFKNFSTVIDVNDSLKAKSILVKNFIDPTLVTDLDLTLKSKTLFDIVQFKGYAAVDGRIHMQLKYDGKLNYLFGKSSVTPVMEGYIDLEKMKLKLNKVHFAFDKLDGRIDFRNDTVRMNKLAIQSGKTDMKITGTAYHLFNSVFNDTTGLDMKINFESTNFYFSDFNSPGSTGNKSAKDKDQSNHNKKVVENGNIILPYNLKAVLKGKVKNFYARQYHGNDIELDIKLSNKKVDIVESMRSFGGHMNFVSSFTPVKNEIHCKSNISMRKFQIDKVFSAFNSFNQKMLTQDNIKGVISGDIYFFFKMDSKLSVDSNSIFVNGTYNINKLQLINVEPLMKLTKVGFEEKDLSKVTFENISSSIIVKDHVIEIPRTLYVSNILYFYLDVTITPDGESNFYVLLPVKNMKKKPDTKDLTNDSKAGLSIPIRITGKAGKLKVL
ncbi:MAG: hypothetical protein ACTHJT_14590 [Cytophaga sp.]|uniref:hypothetical protein n=1 Tax=Cytophaga sp. TaxID=29535 RepID=UPI003F81C07B